MTRKQQHVFSPQGHMYLYEVQKCITLQTDDLQLALFSFCLPLKSESLHSLSLFMYVCMYLFTYLFILSPHLSGVSTLHFPLFVHLKLQPWLSSKIVSLALLNDKK